jgi:transcription elongation factor Elf1
MLDSAEYKRMMDAREVCVKAGFWMHGKLQYTCPDCSLPLRKVESMNVATQVVKRTCRNCGQHWQIVIRPVEVTMFGKPAWLDEGTFARID